MLLSNPSNSRFPLAFRRRACGSLLASKRDTIKCSEWKIAIRTYKLHSFPTIFEKQQQKPTYFYLSDYFFFLLMCPKYCKS